MSEIADALEKRALASEKGTPMRSLITNKQLRFTQNGPRAIAAVVGALGVLAGTAGASSPAPSGPVPSSTVTVTSQSRPVQQITPAQYAAAAAQAGVAVPAVAVSGAQAASTSCYSYWFGQDGTNSSGVLVWQFSLEPYWCSNGSYLTSAFTSVAGNTYGGGWSYYGEIEAGTEYGVGWNDYYTYAQGKFCASGCGQEAEPFIQATAYANGTAYGS